MASVKKNVVYKSLLTISSYLIAFITFPYITRVLGVDKIGIVNFVDNTVNYFLLFATMGISLLGTREIAMVKDNNQERSRVFSNILGLNLLFTIVVLLLFILLVFIIPQLYQYKCLFFIGASKILFTVFVVEWFYTGIEKFKYITYRTLLIKTIYVIAVFVLVQNEDDYVLYFILTVSVVLLNAIINFLQTKKYIVIRWNELFKFTYIKQSLTLGIYNLMTSTYITFNVMFLGFVSSNTEVGYYTTAFKLYAVILSLFSALTEVMLPRMSSLIALGNNEAFRLLANKSLTIIVNISIPLIVIGTMMAPQIIFVIAGSGYEGAILPMQVIMPALLPVGIAQVLSRQILLPLKKEYVLLNASIVGGLIAIIINFLLVGHLQSFGSSIVLLMSEYLVTGIYIVYIIKEKMLNYAINTLSKSIICAVLLMVTCWLVSSYVKNSIFSLILVFLLGTFVVLLVYKKDMLTLIKRK